MRRRSIGLLAVSLVLGFTLVGCPTDGGDDDGITKISAAEEFNAIRNRLDGHYVLEADIDLASYENFVSIGTFAPLSDAPEEIGKPRNWNWPSPVSLTAVDTKFRMLLLMPQPKCG
jgi:hypothetical protein